MSLVFGERMTITALRQPSHTPQPVPIEIKRLIAREMDVTLAEIASGTRTKTVAEARKLIVWAARKAGYMDKTILFDFSLYKHSSDTSHVYREIHQRRQTNAAFRAFTDRLLMQLGVE